MIQLTDVKKSYQRGDTEVLALRGISCHIPKYSLTFIVGPSGCGKSTLLHLLGSLDQPTSGKIVVDGQLLGQLSRKKQDDYRRSQVGFIFQNFNLLNNLTALENVLAPFVPSGISAEQHRRATELLADVGLKDRIDHRPRQLSGGEQQRVAIARALLKKPSLILADEPTGELDSTTGQEVFGHLRRLHTEQKTTVVIVTHDERYFTKTDHILRLLDGQIDTQ